MVRTTPAPEFDLPSLFPAIAALARQTVRLHPRPDRDVAVNASKWGGRLLWPADEEWPICTEPEWLREGESTPQHEHRYIPMLQLRKGDFPELSFPGDTDLFQLLWCPNDHELTLSVICKVFWRKESDVAGPIAEVPKPTLVEADYLPRPCRLHPERVTEYPSQGNLPTALDDAIHDWESERGIEGPYFYEMSVAPGTKIGGYVRWIQFEWIPVCECGQAMEHLLTVASDEFGGSWPRWYPLEDVQATGLSQEQLETDYAYLDALKDADRSSGIMLGDSGSLYLFICHNCPTWPIDWIVQSC